MSGFQPTFGKEMAWVKNVLGSEVARLFTQGARLTVVRGDAGYVVPAHGYTRGCVIYVVSGRVEIDGKQLEPGDAGTYNPPGYFAVRFVEPGTYVVARAADDDLTLPDYGEMSVANPDA